MLLKSKRSACGSILPLRILSLEDGKVLKSFHLALLPNKEIEFFELFHDKILLKQESECLQMVDVHSEKRTELSGREFEKPSTFISLIMKRLFLIFSSGTGNCCAMIRGSDPDVGISRPNLSVIQSTFQDTLEDITALFYDEDRNEIYTGNSRGLLHLWSN
ncbi:hypothetical protein SUGI_1172450 [Cryptomeria japonica]|nr:hypothetical protein SUGI_1172450 [Cryptomeria japonica]